MERKLRIKKFVQTVLGCACPDKVFEQIEDRVVSSTSAPHTRSLTIGGILLIYIWEDCEPIGLETGLQAMLQAGRREREARRLNRFRAVLAVEAPLSVAAWATFFFSQYEDKDERMHLHVVSKDHLKWV